MDFIGVVLAGGEGRRMGRPKGDIEVDGLSLAERAASVLDSLCTSVLVSIRPGRGNPAPGRPGVEDAVPAGKGPLAGIHSAFAATAVSDLLVVACDYPNIEPAHLREIVRCAQENPHADLVIATDSEGRDHPLVGVWRRRLLSRLSSALESGRYKVTDFVGTCDVRRVAIAETNERGGAVLANWNEPRDMEAP